MLFNSLEFLVFFPAIVVFYYSCPKRYQWPLLLIASYGFYMWWRAPYILLILGSTAVDYWVSVRLHRSSSRTRRKRLLFVSLFLNLGMLSFFKYSQFFATSISGLLAAVGLNVHIPSSGLQLPVGISFYTLQTLSYTIEVFRKNAKPEKHIGIFALYVVFFPQLVAGPIERPQNLIPQLKSPKKLDLARITSGVRLMIWGGFQKVVIADQLSLGVNFVFGTPDGVSGSLVLVGSYLFAFQIYCDFAGYSNIAIGAARILGIDLMDNFKRPYFSTSIQMFWRRWHISLSTWFRDYLYIPLGGSRKGRARTYLNLLIVFLVSGLWHGANWTYICWGGVHGVLLVCGIWMRSTFSDGVPFLPMAARRALATLLVFHLVCFAWVLFRATSMGHALSMFETLFLWKNSDIPFSIPSISWPLVALGGIVLLLVEAGQEWASRRDIVLLDRIPPVLQHAGLMLLVLWIAAYGVFDRQEFVYWKF